MSLQPTLRKASELGLALTAIAALILAGCGGGGSSSSGGTSAATTTTTVTPYKGMFTDGTVTLVDANGNTVTLSAGTGQINASGVATVTYPSNVAYPLTVNVAGTYLDETAGGASAVIAAGSPLQGLIPSTTEAASGVPVTTVTHIARTTLPASGFSAASAVAAITGAASSVLGVSSYSQAMLPPVFNHLGQTSDPATIKLAALANAIGQQGSGADLGAKLHDIASKLAAGSAVTAVIPQNVFDAALAAVNQVGGVSGVVPVGAAAPTIPPITLPGGGLDAQIAALIPTCAAGQVVMPSPTGLKCVSGGTDLPTPTITGFSPTTGAVGTTVTITGTNLVDAFPPAPKVGFGNTGAGSYSNLSNTSITVTVPAGLAAGSYPVTVYGMGGTPISVGTFTVTAPVATAPDVPVGLTATVASSSQIDLSWTAAANATGYNLYRANAAYFPTSLVNKLNATPITGTTYNDTGLTAGTTYFYKVVAVNTPAALQSMASTEVSATTQAAGGGTLPAAPTGVSTGVGGADRIILGWTAVTGANTYRIYRSTTAGQPISSMTPINAGATTGLTYLTVTDTGLTVGLTYYYKVTAISDTAGESVASAEVSVTPYNLGTVSQIAGIAGSGSAGSLDGTGTATSFNSPMGIAADAAAVYVADSGNNKIRKIDLATGGVSTFAGSGAVGAADGTGTAASFANPMGVAVDAAGTVYVADTDINRIRMISPAGVVTTFTAASLSQTPFNRPQGVAVDVAGNVYVADTNNHKIRMISPAGVVSTFAGSGAIGAADGTGTAASFNYPTGVTVDAVGNVFVADSGNNKIRKITPDGVVTTFAGGNFGSADGTGTAASFKGPTGVAVDAAGNVYVADNAGGKIRKITSAGVVTTFAGMGTAGVNSSGTFASPFGVAVDATGNVYMTNTGRHQIFRIK